MKTSTQHSHTTRHQAQRLTIVAAVVRWNRGGAGGRCADCGRLVAPGALPRTLVHAYASRPPEQLVRLSLVAPGTRAESAQVDQYLRETMQKQRRQQRRARQSPVVSRAICFSCAVRMLNSYLHTDGGTLTGALAAITPNSWTALLMACEVGFGRALVRFAVNGRGQVPALSELIELANAGALKA